MREARTAIRCDRCGVQDLLSPAELDPENARGNWVKIRAETLDGKTVVADANDETGTADLCFECTEGLVQWFEQPRLDKIREASRA